MEVVPFKPKEKVIDESVVAKLEEALEEAKSGKYVAVGIIGVEHDRSVTTMSSLNEALPTLIGGCYILAHRLIDMRRTMDMQEEDPA